MSNVEKDMEDIMNTPELPNTEISRRSLLRFGGMAVTAGALLAACSDSATTTNAPANIGTAPETTALENLVVTDETLLRTAMALELNLIDAYQSMISSKYLAGDALTAANSLIADHTAHAASLRGLVKTPVEEKNAKIDSLYIAPALALVAGSDSKSADALALMNALENLAANTYQAFVGWINNPATRAAAMKLGAHESRHAAATALMARKGDSAIAGVLPENDDLGKPLAAAFPGTFGSLSSVQVQLGKTTEAGTRTTIIMDTPSLNSMSYEDQSSAD